MGRCGMGAVVVAVVVVVGLAATCVHASPPTWQTLMAKAQEEARGHDKLILVSFIGSDWCSNSADLKRDVFDTFVFADWAEKSVVLLEVDFPRKARQPPAVKNQNERLKAELKIDSLPAVVFLDSEGNEVGRIPGYANGEADAWMEKARAIVASRPRMGLCESLAAAVSQARREGKALLLIVSNGRAPDSAAKVAALVGNADLVRLANTRMIAVHLKSPDDLRGDNLVRRRELVHRYSLVDQLDTVAVIDMANDKVLYTADSLPAPEDVVKAVKDVLPLPKYDGSWLDDFARAQSLAAALNRPMLLDFTGSDWCPWCIKLDNEIFSTQQFKDYAREKLVLVKLDFPQNKKLAPETVAQNRALATKYSIRGYPTVVILDASDAPLGRMGYMEGGPEPFLKRLADIMQRTARKQ
jgi:protein disulfide-isomerase